jgi:hypothetical protein
MARTYLIFGDIESKLDVLRVECGRCQWKEQLNGDCPKRDEPQMHERCDLICPDLPKVL